MKHSINVSYLILGLLLWIGNAHAVLLLKVVGAKTYSQKTIVKIELQNTFTNAIESARAVVFLLDDKGQVVGQETRWIIGGAKDRPPLGPDSKTAFHFVVQSAKPFTKSNVVVTRLILAGGRLADANKEVRIEFAMD